MACILISTIIDLALAIFHDELITSLWLNTPNSIFEGYTPLQFCNKGDVGSLRVLTILERIKEYSEVESIEKLIKDNDL